MWRLRYKKGHHENYMKSSLQQNEEKNVIYFLGDRQRQPETERERERLPNSCAKCERGVCANVSQVLASIEIETCGPVKKRRRTRITGIAIIDESCTQFAVCAG